MLLLHTLCFSHGSALPSLQIIYDGPPSMLHKKNGRQTQQSRECLDCSSIVLLGEVRNMAASKETSVLVITLVSPYRASPSRGLGEHPSGVIHCPALFLCDTLYHLNSSSVCNCLHGCVSYFSPERGSMKARIYSSLFTTVSPGVEAVHAACSHIYQLVNISWTTKQKVNEEHTLGISRAS